MADWTVYMLRCADGSLYTGIARDAAARLSVHNAGRGAKYTKARRPVALVWSEPAACRSTASKREYSIKQLGRSEKLALIRS
ncbi:GIY-YIG nuclease family protein [Algimonas porphyrae]|uniref:GIY-YIG nuclease family protein n=1 Tax=Algimonas porphyrae TaxID=1128113 RepID=A0ABQ5V1Y0_9PROT|nr:GIY-YIG nuclease family protein [Algimonas porphyrae]GLQ21087.1 GIY-YIG nuclease family protein [Algimonas porphyrae]